MCGIVGILNTDIDTFSKRESIRKMISTLIHRGPDGWGFYIADCIALGNTRLSIIDLSDGHQPMVSERYVISFNGEIYNHIELREELKQRGFFFSTRSDTEVILKAFEAYGTEAVEKLNGQFAFVLWDRIDRKVIVARDRYGIRPLYILEHRGAYYFSSEMKAFDTIEGFYRRINIQSLFEHGLFWNTIGDDTIFDDIRSLPAGTLETIELGKPPIQHRYYEIGESSGVSPATFNEAIEIFSDLLKDAVRLRLRSDVPVGCYLSGGIDSSVVTHLTSLLNKEHFKTFSVSFEDKDFDEAPFQREMASQIDSDHLELEIDYDMIDKHFIDAVYHFERPVFRTAPVPLFLLSDKVRNSGMKVVLTGEGADEVLFGYDSYKELKLLEFWSREPASNFRPLLLKKLYPHLRHFSDPRRFRLIRMFYETFLHEYDNDLVGLNIRTHNNKILANFFNKDFDITFDRDKTIEKIRSILPDNFRTWTLLQKNQFMEMKTLLSGYLLSSQGDRMSMAHSVEGRYPFLDHRLVEKLFYFRDTFKLKAFSQKHLLREAFRGVIPGSIIDRPKMPYQAPDLKSFIKKGTLSSNAKRFLSKDFLDESGIFDEKYVNRFLRKFERQVPREIGYRDNMLITFLLSSQMLYYWTKNPKQASLDESKKKVAIVES